MTKNHTLSRDDFKAKQTQDKFCTALKVEKEKETSEYFADLEGLIYRRRKNREHQLIVPTSKVQEVISLNHGHVFVTHPGRNKKLESLCTGFYWPGMQKEVGA
jgi:hypothetical protein